jgi:type VI secretion system secreted protein Hcp
VSKPTSLTTIAISSILTAILLGPVIVSDAYAAVNMFIKIGDIRGESTDSEHKDWIDVLSYSLGAGITDGKRKVGSLKIEHNLDSSTPLLYKSLLTGEKMNEARLQLCKTGGSKMECFMEYKLENAIVSKILTERTNTKDIQKEEISLEFDKITFTYTKELGGKLKDTVSYCWDAKQNKTCDQPKK